MPVAEMLLVPGPLEIRISKSVLPYQEGAFNSLMCEISSDIYVLKPT